MTIRNKLIIYTFLSTLVTLVIVGFSINVILTETYNENANTELDNSYQRLQHDLTAIENDILVQSLQIATDTSVIAITNLINRYQNIKNYQPLVFNNDKKKLASHLRSQISLTDADRAMIYSKSGELIAYALQNGLKNEIGITSYNNGKVTYLINTKSSTDWLPGDKPKTIPEKLSPLSNQTSFLNYPGKIEYRSKESKLVIGNDRVITRNLPNGKTVLLGIVRVNKSLDDEFFKQLSGKAGTQVSLLLKSGELLNKREQLLPVKDLSASSQLHGSISSAEEKLLASEKYHIHSYTWPTESGNNYILMTLPKKDLISALNKTRNYLLIVFVLTATLGIVFGIFWLNKLISNPLKALVQHALISGENKQPTFPVSEGNDEISILGKTLNTMVSTIVKRGEDLTARSKQLTNAQRLAKMGDWELDHATDTMMWSDEAYNIFDLDPIECIPSREAIISIMHPDDVSITLEAFEKSLEEKIAFDVIYRIVTKNKKIKFIRTYGETFYDNDENPFRSVGTMQDVTEQISKDEQLRRTQKMDALGKLTGGIAHDFNNMLGVILGFGELLQTSSLCSDEKNSTYIKEIINAAERARKLTAKLLVFSRKDTTSSTRTDLNQLLLDEQTLLEKTLTVRVQLKLNLEDDLWPVYLDKNDLEDAIVNMSINAMHAIPENGELILSTKNISLNTFDVQDMGIPANDYVLFSVSDTGVGMDSATVEKMFEPFFTTKKEKGTGLGLSQVYGFVQRSKGSIQVYSEPGHGTRITIYLPRYQKDQAGPSSVQQNDTTAIEDLTGTSTILVVDDERPLRALAKEILTSKGYKVLTADGGDQALKTLEGEPVDLILSDVIMPGMNGYQLAEKVKEKHPQIKIQIASGFSDVQDHKIIDSQLYKHRLQKPFTSTSLLKRVKELLLEP